MKMIRKISILAILLGAFTFSASAQKNLGKEADKHFDAQEYYLAAGYYKKAYEKEKKADKKARFLFQMAECYRHINDLKTAETYYAKAIKAKYPDPIGHLHVANIKKEFMRYDEAIVEYQNYQKEVPSSKEAELGIKSCELAQKWKDAPTRHVVENMAFINSKDNDYSPCFSDQKKYTKMIISSNREGAAGTVDQITGHNHTELFETQMDKAGKWSEPKALPEPINSKYNDGSAYVTKKGDIMYYTRCDEEKNKVLGCQLWMSHKSGPNWGLPEKLPFDIDTISFRHPALSPEGDELYFASTMAGGYGGHDIWKCTYDKKSKSWGTPVNLGPTINTPFSEAYPFMFDDGKTLYFASNGHPGMGGLDIFKAEMGTDGKFTKAPENLKYPMNSPHDDFGIIFEGKKERGYFSSDRDGTKGGDDIWGFVLPPLIFELEGYVTDASDKKPVQNAMVTITGTDGSNFPVKTDDKGHYSTRLVPETNYEVTCETDKNTKNALGYQFLANEDKGKFTTVGELASKKYRKDFELTPVPPNVEIHFPEVQYDLGKWDLRPESKDSLEYLYKILVANPTIIIELSAHTDSRGSTKDNDTLSSRRARSCYNYLVVDKKINGARIIPKGYGERKLKITDKVIAKAKTKEEKEALHQKNRRTVFKVISWDFIDPKAPAKPPVVRPKISGEEAETAPEN